MQDFPHPKYTIIAPDVNINDSEIKIDIAPEVQPDQIIRIPSIPKVDTLDIDSCHIDKKSLTPSQPTKVRLNWTPVDEKEERRSLGDPDVWGPAFWFSLHNGANQYPLEASPCVVDRTVGFIRGLPMMLPCIECKEHANRYIAEHDASLHTICKTRESLFKFYVDFHNSVNERKSKPRMSVEEAKQLYNGYTLSSLKYSSLL